MLSFNLESSLDLDRSTFYFFNTWIELFYTQNIDLDLCSKRVIIQ